MAPVLVQNAQGSAFGTASIAVGSLSIPMGANVTSGNCIVVAIGLETSSTNVTVTSVTVGGSADNFSTSALFSAGTSGTGPGRGELWADPNCAGGGSTITITTSGAQDSELIFAYVYEVSGLVNALGSLADKTASNVMTSDSATLSSGATATTTQASEFWIGFAVDGNTNSVTPTGPASPWVNLSAISASSAGFANCAISGYQIVSAEAAATYAITQYSGADGTAFVAALHSQTAVNATITGVVVNVTTGPQAGLVTIALPGPAAVITVTAPAGMIAIQGGYITVGQPARITAQALAGFASINLIGPVAAVTVTCPAGSNLLCYISVNPPVPAEFTFMAQRVLRQGQGKTHRRRAIPSAIPGGAHSVPVAMGQPPPQITWNDRKAVTVSSRVISWDIYHSENNAAQSGWNVWIRISTAAALAYWNDGDPVSKTASAAWDNYYRAAAPVYMYWITFHGSVTVTAKVAWNTSTVIVNVTATAAWNTRQLVSPVLLATWDVGLVVVNAQALITWNTGIAVTVISLASWNTSCQIVNAAASAAWNLLQRVPVTGVAAWNTVSTRLAGWPVWWNTRLPVSSPVSATAWDITGKVNASLSYEGWDACGRISQAASIAWQAHRYVTAVHPAAWNTAARVNPARLAYWNDRATVAAGEGTGFSVLVPVLKTSTAGWNTLHALTGQTSEISWKITPAQGAAATAWWNTRYSTATTVPAVYWNTRAQTAQSSAVLGWNGRQAITSSPALAAWGVIFHVDPGASIAWDTIVLVPAVSAAIQWNIGQPQQGDMRLATMDEWLTPE